jgi:hypothetical protein
MLPAQKRHHIGVIILSALAIGICGNGLYRGQLSAQAQQTRRITIVRSANVLSVARQVSTQENVILAATVEDAESLSNSIRPGTKSVDSVLEELRAGLKARKYEKAKEGICFVSAVPLPEPHVNLNNLFEGRLTAVKNMDAFLTSLTPSQRAEMKQNGSRIAYGSLTSQQATLLREITPGLGSMSLGAGQKPSPDASVEVSFRTWATIYPSDGSPLVVQIPKQP